MPNKLYLSRFSFVDVSIVLLTACSICGIFLNNWLLGAILGVPAFGLATWKIWAHRKGITRWAKKNPIKTKFLLALIQLVLLVLGSLLGHNLSELDIVLPNMTFWVFGALMILGFTMVPLARKKSSLTLPAQLRKHRLIYAGIGLCLVGIMSSTGNRLEVDFPDHVLTKIVLSIDNQLFPQLDQDAIVMEESSDGGWSVVLTSQTEGQSTLSKKELRKQKRLERRIERKRDRKAFMTMLLAATGGILALLAIATCLGVCVTGGGIALFIAGISNLGWAVGEGLLMMLGGVAGVGIGVFITRLSIRAIRSQGPPR